MSPPSSIAFAFNLGIVLHYLTVAGARLCPGLHMIDSPKAEIRLSP
jgi:hypothetical protein